MSDPKGLKHARGDENDGNSTIPSSKRGKRNDGTYFRSSCSFAPTVIPPKAETHKNILEDILAIEIIGKDTHDFLMGAKKESAQHHAITKQPQRPELYHTAPEVSTPGDNLLLNEQFLEADLQAVRGEYAELEAQLNELALLPQGQHQDTEAAIQNQIERLLNQRIVLHGTIKSSEQWLQDIRHSGGDPLENAPFQSGAAGAPAAVVVVEDVDLGAELPWIDWTTEDVRNWDALRAAEIADLPPLDEEHIAKYGPGNERARWWERRILR
ncbi:uncharacterized protein PG986_009983 [Apiospora aurea]|uniref:Uncharacterized protein n=1 Tax=Apiospora aurea TaxID=335848 RepID=A0ABR1Q983_9PEZI